MVNQIEMNSLFQRLRTLGFKSLVLLLFCFCVGCENESIENLEPSAKNVAITFDDGPEPRYTEMILDILKEKNVKATFFLVGNKIKRNPKIAKRIFNEGHCLANHTYTHIDLKKTASIKIHNEIQQTEQLIVNICGKSKKLIRPPWGHIADLEKNALENLGYKIVLWDINSYDFIPNTNAGSIHQNVMGNIAANKIILFHDADYKGKASRQNTVIALPQIIDSLKALGYNLVTIDKMNTINQ